MAQLRETHNIVGPFIDWDPLDTALLFLRTNRYQTVSTQLGPLPDALEHRAPETAAAAEVAADPEDSAPPAEVLVKVEVSRGTPGRGWTSSNLAELPTRLELTLRGNEVLLTYEVETTGQILRGDEREFWKREAEALSDYLTKDAAIPNIVAEETARAAEVRRELAIMGLWIGALVSALIVVLFILLAP